MVATGDDQGAVRDGQGAVRIERGGAEDDHEILVKSYRYLRAAMVVVLLWLAAAVLLQTGRQDGDILSSISAYYYTPAQAVFVGALVALGVCMIALQGTTPAEDILLNIGGMFAPIVALVPTARAEDIRAVLEQCREASEPVYNEQGTPVDCEAFEAAESALAAATRLNIENNVTALFIAGLVGLAATVVLHLLDKEEVPRFWRNFTFAAGLYVVGAAFFFRATDGFILRAHMLAAVGLFACIVLVAVVNALRKAGVRLSEHTSPGSKARKIGGVVVSLDNPYSVVAGLMVLAVAVGVPANIFNWIPDALFWLEATLIVLFAALWIVQTKDRWRHDPPLEQPARSAEPVPVGAA